VWGENIETKAGPEVTEITKKNWFGVASGGSGAKRGGGGTNEKEHGTDTKAEKGKRLDGEKEKKAQERKTTTTPVPRGVGATLSGMSDLLRPLVGKGRVGCQNTKTMPSRKKPL